MYSAFCLPYGCMLQSCLTHRERLLGSDLEQCKACNSIVLMQDCKAAVQRDPKEFAAWFNKGNVEARLQQYDSAFDSYRQAADLAPGIIGKLTIMCSQCFLGSCSVPQYMLAQQRLS